MRIREEKLHRTKGAKVAFGVAFAVFALYTLYILFSVAWTFLQSLKTNREFIGDMISLPKDWLFSNYPLAFDKIKYSDTKLLGMFVNSVWFTVGTSLLGVFMHCVTGYCFAKYRFRGKELAFSFIIFTLILPVVGNLPAMYRLVRGLRLNDSPMFLITALGGFGANFLIMFSFFKGIDSAYAEAASIDGAGHFYIFFRIMIPLASAPVFALSIVGIISQWNNYETPLLFMDKMPTLASGLYYYKSFLIYESNTPAYLAGVLVSTIPVLILVSVFGNKIMKNMTMGGIKG